MLAIEDVIAESWNYTKRSGRYARSVTMNVDTFQHLSRLKDFDGKRFVMRSGDHKHAYLLGIPIMLDSAVVGVKFQDKDADEWECEYCGIVWPTSIASVQCANCGGLRSR